MEKVGDLFGIISLSGTDKQAKYAILRKLLEERLIKYHAPIRSIARNLDELIRGALMYEYNGITRENVEKHLREMVELGTTEAEEVHSESESDSDTIERTEPSPPQPTETPRTDNISRIKTLHYINTCLMLVCILGLDVYGMKPGMLRRYFW